MPPIVVEQEVAALVLVIEKNAISTLFQDVMANELFPESGCF